MFLYSLKGLELDKKWVLTVQIHAETPAGLWCFSSRTTTS